MKKSILCILGIICVAGSVAASDNDFNSIKHKWLGKLEIPNGPKLTVTHWLMVQMRLLPEPHIGSH